MRTNPPYHASRRTFLWKHYVRPFLIIAVALFVFRSSILDWNVVPTGSMQPTIVEGDYVLVNKLAYDVRFPFTGWNLVHSSDPRRGDIVIFELPNKSDRYIKRIVGVPGDSLEVRQQRVFVNGAPLNEDPAPMASPRPSLARRLPLPGQMALADMILPEGEAGDRFGPVRVPEGHFFVLGDNRANSMDSRSFGFVPRSHLLGRAMRVLVSVDPQAHWTPRMDRFLQTLA